VIQPVPLAVRKAVASDAPGISRVCSAGWRATYANLYTPAKIEATVAEFYAVERIAREIGASEGWNGWWLELDGEMVVGAGGGAFQPLAISDLYVLYVDPGRRGRGHCDRAARHHYRRAGWAGCSRAVGPGERGRRRASRSTTRDLRLHGMQPAFGDSLAPERQSQRYWRSLAVAPDHSCASWRDAGR
jgi:hypothetical protein